MANGSKFIPGAKTIKRATITAQTGLKPFYTYDSVIKDAGVRFSIDGIWIMAGFGQTYTTELEANISIVEVQMRSCLRKLLPVLREYQLNFTCIIGDYEQYRLNSGIYGFENIGKGIKVQFANLEVFKSCIATIIGITNEFQGPLIRDSLQISNNVYLTCAGTNQMQPLVKLQTALRKHLKVHGYLVDRTAEKRNSFWQKKFFKGRYAVLKILANGRNGIVCHAIDFGAFFKECIIKIGFPFASSDQQGRTVADKLRNEYEIMSSTAAKVTCMPQAYDFFQQDGFTCLVTEYIDGTNFSQIIKAAHQSVGSSASINKDYYKEILLNSCHALQEIHKEGIIHRDFAPNNIKVAKKGTKVTLLDYELSYNLEQPPTAPFMTGTVGYASPEQLKASIPTTAEDVYSVVNLWLYMLTGLKPESIDKSPGNIEQLLKGHTNKEVTKIIIQGLAQHASNRPTIEQLIKTIAEN